MRAGVPAGLGRCWAGRLGAGFGLYMTLTANGRQAGASPHLFALSRFVLFSLPLWMSSRSCWLCLFDLGGQAGGIGAAGGVSVWPWCWACRALLRHGAGLAALVPCLLSVSPAGRAGAVCAGAGAGAGHGRRSQAKRLANRQNAQRFNKKCSIMTKIMSCILCFLRCKYACFGVK